MLAACGGSGGGEHAKKESPSPAVAVNVIRTAVGEAATVYEAPGTVRAQTEAALSSRVMGYVREVRAVAGDAVRGGQTLVVLDSRDLEAAQRQAEAAVREARSGLAEANNGLEAARAQTELSRATFKRMKELFEKTSVSNQEFDEATARLRAAEAAERAAVSRRAQMEERIKQAEEGAAAAGIQRGYAEIRAPFDGRVIERKVEPGNLAMPGVALLTVERGGGFRLEAAVEESKLPEIRRGQRTGVVLEALGKTVEGTVAEIVPAVDPGSRSALVKINLPASPGLRSGMFGRARFPGGPRQALTVPAGAVLEQGQVRTVLVAERGYARARLVTTGERTEGRVEILSGLAAGDAVIFPKIPGLADGARVEVR